MKPIYTAATEDEALFALEELAEKWDEKYPIISRIVEIELVKNQSDVPVSGTNQAGDLPRRTSSNH